MNKDLDERLIPPGQYRDGQYIGVSTSEDSNVGSKKLLVDLESRLVKDI